MGYAVQTATTTQPLVFKMYETGTLTPATGKTVTVVLSKNGASFASPSGAVSEIGNGLYKVAGNATDNNTLGVLNLYATATGCDATDETYQVVSYNPLNANLGLPNLDAAITSRMASYTQPTGFLAATFPSTVASPTNITAGTITTVTNLTNAPTNGDFTSTMKASIATAVWTTAAVRRLSDATNITSTGDPVYVDAAGYVNPAPGSINSSVIDPSVYSEIADVVADYVWGEALTDHNVSGSMGATLAAVEGKTDQLTFSIADKLDVNLTALWGQTTIDASDRAPGLT